MKYATISLLLTISLLVAACELSSSEEVKGEATQSCLDKYCPKLGDKYQRIKPATEIALMLNRRWFVGPSEYFSAGNNGALFYWPSRHPGYKPGSYPERKEPFILKSVEVLLRSVEFDKNRGKTHLLERWGKEGRILKKTQLREGLEVLQVNREEAWLKNELIYVATNLKDEEGQHPWISCDHSFAQAPATAKYLWRDGIYMTIRIGQNNCADWPDIYLEVMRVLNLLQPINH